MKSIYNKPTSNIILFYCFYCKKLEIIPLNEEQDMAIHFFFLFNAVLEDLARTISQEKEITGIQIRKEKLKVFLFADDIIL